MGYSLAAPVSEGIHLGWELILVRTRMQSPGPCPALGRQNLHFLRMSRGLAPPQQSRRRCSQAALWSLAARLDPAESTEKSKLPPAWGAGRTSARSAVGPGIVYLTFTFGCLPKCNGHEEKCPHRGQCPGFPPAGHTPVTQTRSQSVISTQDPADALPVATPHPSKGNQILTFHSPGSACVALSISQSDALSSSVSACLSVFGQCALLQRWLWGGRSIPIAGQKSLEWTRHSTFPLPKGIGLLPVWRDRERDTCVS